jgi:hypothetical protein
MDLVLGRSGARGLTPRRRSGVGFLRWPVVAAHGSWSWHSSSRRGGTGPCCNSPPGPACWSAFPRKGRSARPFPRRLTGSIPAGCANWFGRGGPKSTARKAPSSCSNWMGWRRWLENRYLSLDPWGEPLSSNSSWWLRDGPIPHRYRHHARFDLRGRRFDSATSWNGTWAQAPSS